MSSSVTLILFYLLSCISFWFIFCYILPVGKWGSFNHGPAILISLVLSPFIHFDPAPISSSSEDCRQKCLLWHFLSPFLGKTHLLPAELLPYFVSFPCDLCFSCLCYSNFNLKSVFAFFVCISFWESLPCPIPTHCRNIVC